MFALLTLWATKVNKHKEYLAYRFDLARSILNDGNTFLWTRTHVDQAHKNSALNPPIGGGNWLIIAGDFSVLFFLAAVNWYEKDRRSLIQRWLARLLPGRFGRLAYRESRAVRELILELPRGMISGMPTGSRQIDKIISGYRHALTHAAAVAKGYGGAVVEGRVGYASGYSQIDTVLPPSFHKEGRVWLCSSDRLNKDMYNVVDYIEKKLQQYSPTQLSDTFHHLNLR